MNPRLQAGSPSQSSLKAQKAGPRHCQGERREARFNFVKQKWLVGLFATAQIALNEGCQIRYRTLS